MTNKIDLLLLCGFLGAGKTTLLLNLLDLFPELKIGIIENEFGEVNIDGALIEQDTESKISLIEITNGSMFCSCRHEDLIEALRKMSEFPLDLLILESTGIADPSPFKRDIATVNKLEGKIYRYAGSICVVDGMTFFEMLDILEAIRRQITYSDLILLNKSDRVTPYELGRIRSEIGNINSEARIINTEFCKISRKLVEATLAQTPDSIFQPGINTTENKPSKLILSSINPIVLPQLREFMDHITGRILRLKGFCKIGTPAEFIWYFIDGTRNTLTMVKRNPPENLCEQTRLVIILTKGDPYTGIIREAWGDLIIVEK